MSIWWKIGGAAIALAAAYLLVTMYGGAREQAGRAAERSIWEERSRKAETTRLDAFRAGLAQRDQASTVYRETIRQLPPVTNTIIDRTARYASTPDGAVLCLPAERVHGIEQTRSALFPAAPAAPAARADGAVPAEAAGTLP